MCHFHNFKSSFNNFCSTTYYFSISNDEYLKEDFALKKNHLTFVLPTVDENKLTLDLPEQSPDILDQN